MIEEDSSIVTENRTESLPIDCVTQASPPVVPQKLARISKRFDEKLNSVITTITFDNVDSKLDTRKGEWKCLAAEGFIDLLNERKIQHFVDYTIVDFEDDERADPDYGNKKMTKKAKGRGRKKKNRKVIKISAVADVEALYESYSTAPGDVSYLVDDVLDIRTIGTNISCLLLWNIDGSTTWECISLCCCEELMDTYWHTRIGACSNFKKDKEPGSCNVWNEEHEKFLHVCYTLGQRLKDDHTTSWNKERKHVAYSKILDVRRNGHDLFFLVVCATRNRKYMYWKAKESLNSGDVPLIEKFMREVIQRLCHFHQMFLHNCLEAFNDCPKTLKNYYNIMSLLHPYLCLNYEAPYGFAEPSDKKGNKKGLPYKEITFDVGDLEKTCGIDCGTVARNALFFPQCPFLSNVFYKELPLIALFNRIIYIDSSLIIRKFRELLVYPSIYSKIDEAIEFEFSNNILKLFKKKTFTITRPAISIWDYRRKIKNGFIRNSQRLKLNLFSYVDCCDYVNVVNHELCKLDDEALKRMRQKGERNISDYLDVSLVDSDCVEIVEWTEEMRNEMAANGYPQYKGYVRYEIVKSPYYKGNQAAELIQSITKGGNISMPEAAAISKIIGEFNGAVSLDGIMRELIIKCPSPEPQDLVEKADELKHAEGRSLKRVRSSPSLLQSDDDCYRSPTQKRKSSLADAVVPEMDCSHSASFCIDETEETESSDKQASRIEILKVLSEMPDFQLRYQQYQASYGLLERPVEDDSDRPVMAEDDKCEGDDTIREHLAVPRSRKRLLSSAMGSLNKVQSFRNRMATCLTYACHVVQMLLKLTQSFDILNMAKCHTSFYNEAFAPKSQRFVNDWSEIRCPTGIEVAQAINAFLRQTRAFHYCSTPSSSRTKLTPEKAQLVASLIRSYQNRKQYRYFQRAKCLNIKPIKKLFTSLSSGEKNVKNNLQLQFEQIMKNNQYFNGSKKALNKFRRRIIEDAVRLFKFVLATDNYPNQLFPEYVKDSPCLQPPPLLYSVASCFSMAVLPPTLSRKSFLSNSHRLNSEQRERRCAFTKAMKLPVRQLFEKQLKVFNRPLTFKSITAPTSEVVKPSTVSIAAADSPNDDDDNAKVLEECPEEEEYVEVLDDCAIESTSTTVPISSIVPTSPIVPARTETQTHEDGPNRKRTHSDERTSLAASTSTTEPHNSIVPTSPIVSARTETQTREELSNRKGTHSELRTSSIASTSTILPISSIAPISTTVPNRAIAPNSTTEPHNSIVPTSPIVPARTETQTNGPKRKRTHSELRTSSIASTSTILPISSIASISTTVPNRTIAPNSTTIPINSIVPTSPIVPARTETQTHDDGPKRKRTHSELRTSSIASTSTILPISSIAPISTTVPNRAIAPNSTTEPHNSIVPTSPIVPARTETQTNGPKRKRTHSELRTSSIASTSTILPISSTASISTTVPNRTIAPNSTPVPINSIVPIGPIVPARTETQTREDVPNRKSTHSDVRTSSIASTSTIAPNSTTIPISSTASISTTVPNRTIAPNSTTVPTNSIIPTGPIVPARTETQTREDVPNCRRTNSDVRTSSIASTSTIAPTRTIAPNDTTVPISSIVPTSTIFPSSTIAPTQKIVPASTVTKTGKDVPNLEKANTKICENAESRTARKNVRGSTDVPPAKRTKLIGGSMSFLNSVVMEDETIDLATPTTSANETNVRGSPAVPEAREATNLIGGSMSFLNNLLNDTAISNTPCVTTRVNNPNVPEPQEPTNLIESTVAFVRSIVNEASFPHFPAVTTSATTSNVPNCMNVPTTRAPPILIGSSMSFSNNLITNTSSPSITTSSSTMTRHFVTNARMPLQQSSAFSQSSFSYTEASNGLHMPSLSPSFANALRQISSNASISSTPSPRDRSDRLTSSASFLGPHGQYLSPIWEALSIPTISEMNMQSTQLNVSQFGQPNAFGLQSPQVSNMSSSNYSFASSSEGYPPVPPLNFSSSAQMDLITHSMVSSISVGVLQQYNLLNAMTQRQAATSSSHLSPSDPSLPHPAPPPYPLVIIIPIPAFPSDHALANRQYVPIAGNYYDKNTGVLFSISLFFPGTPSAHIRVENITPLINSVNGHDPNAIEAPTPQPTKPAKNPPKRKYKARGSEDSNAKPKPRKGSKMFNNSI